MDRNNWHSDLASFLDVLLPRNSVVVRTRLTTLPITYIISQVLSSLWVIPVLVYFLGTLSDRIGRKSVILICLACELATTTMLGISTSYPQALVFRIVTGAAYGTIP